METTILLSSLCDYSDTYILVKGIITVPNTGTAAAPNIGDKKALLKNCDQFTDCISKINNTQVESAKGIDVVMPMYDLIEYRDDHSKTLGSLWLYYRSEPV